MAVDEGWVSKRFDDVRRQIQELGPSIAATLAPIVSNLQATIEDTLATNYYTRGQTDAQVSSGVASAEAYADGKLAGTISPAGVSSSGAVQGATGRFNGGLYSTDAYSFNITGTRVAGWHQSDGHIGTASSDENVKTNIEDSGLSSADRATVILESFEVLHYQYKAEVARRDDPDSADYVGPDYHVHVEVGSTAQRLHALGLWEFVIYRRDPVLDDDGAVIGDELAVDEHGNPFPIGIHYELLGLAAIAAAQYAWGEHKKLEARVSALEAAASAS